MSKNGETPSQDLLNDFAKAMAHRGPDGQGFYRHGPVGLAQTRLAIIDLETGEQPIVHPDGRVIAANGEIYNYVELREDLSGTTFKTGSDCEPPLHLHGRKGLAFVDDLRGMYAIAIYDPKGETLSLSRDPFGIKPLYYLETADGFAFASEAQVLIAAGLVAPSVNDKSRDQFLQLQFSCGSETAFKDIRRVLPGETLVIKNGEIIERHQRDALPKAAPKHLSETNALAKLDEALFDSVMVHQRSDVPYGMFLSGGIDSSCLLALMAKLNPRPIKAYTAGFSGATSVHDERDHARSLAAKVGADHVEVDFTEDDFERLLPEIVSFMDDPVADYAILPSYKLAQRARLDVKVILSGEGGDELFGGYGRYRSARRPWPFAKTMRGSGTFDGLKVLRNPSKDWRAGIKASEIQCRKVAQWSKLQQLQGVDCADWLPHDLLIKLDRCLMANAIEGRTPFLDPEVAQVAFTLSDDFKIRGKNGKWLLRKWLETRLPEAKPFSKKRGFSVPVAQWISANGKHLGELVAAQAAIAEIADVEAVKGLFLSQDKRAGFAAWTLLFYALWHRYHIQGRREIGSISDCLCETA